MKPALAGLFAITLVSVPDEIEIGRQANAQVRKQVPEVRDAQTSAYIRDIGTRLVRQAPGPKYPYSFSAADYREINAFSSHPPPQDRLARLQAEMAKRPGGARDSQQFQSIKARLQRMPAPHAMPRN